MTFTARPTQRGYGGAVSTGHHLATQIGAATLANGGNAADAACAAGFALHVLEPTQNGPAGEAPILVHDASQDRTFAISGQGVAPAAATIEFMSERGIDRIPPDGFLAATVPAALDSWCQLLEHFGTKTLAEVVTPARDLAGKGFPMYPFLHTVMKLVEPRLRDWPTSAAVYLPLREVGERQTNAALASFLDELVTAEGNAGGGREAKIRAARDWFYRGPPAERIERFLAEPLRDATGRENAGLLTAHDLASYRGSVEDAVACDYRGARVWKCPPWSQGPVALQHLKLLAGFDLAAMGCGSADFLHTWIECAKLAFADREACYGDPLFAKVPLEELLSEEYAARRRELVDPARASTELTPGMGRLPAGWPWVEGGDDVFEPQAAAAAAAKGRGDTTHLDVADAAGNLVSATPSGGWIPTSPVIPELGFPVGTRAQMFSLDPEHPNALAPGKRPRTTLSPGLALLPDGRRMAFGTPGGDQQDQWPLQLLLALVDFGASDLQEAVEAPTVHSEHMPSSFYPRTARPGVVAFEDRIPEEVISELAARGHVLRSSGPWGHGRVLAVTRHPGTGVCEAAASPRFQVATAAALP